MANNPSDQQRSRRWHPEESSYEGRPDNPPPDTDAGRRGPATGAGGGQPSAPDTVDREEREREGGGAASERD